MLLLLARPPPAASGDTRKSGERAGMDGRHPGGTGCGWGRAAGGRAWDCDSPGGTCALTWSGHSARVLTLGCGLRSVPCVCERSGWKGCVGPLLCPQGRIRPDWPLWSAPSLPSSCFLCVHVGHYGRAPGCGGGGVQGDSAWTPAARPLKRRVRQCDYREQGHLVWEKGQSWEKVA